MKSDMQILPASKDMIAEAEKQFVSECREEEKVVDELCEGKKVEQDDAMVPVMVENKVYMIPEPVREFLIGSIVALRKSEMVTKTLITQVALSGADTTVEN